MSNKQICELPLHLTHSRASTYWTYGFIEDCILCVIQVDIWNKLLLILLLLTTWTLWQYLRCKFLHNLSIRDMAERPGICKQGSWWWRFNSHCHQPWLLQPQVWFRTLLWVCMVWDPHCWWHKHAYCQSLLFTGNQTGRHFSIFSQSWKYSWHK
jgi:hypothetical protein